MNDRYICCLHVMVGHPLSCAHVVRAEVRQRRRPLCGERRRRLPRSHLRRTRQGLVVERSIIGGIEWFFIVFSCFVQLHQTCGFDLLFFFSLKLLLCMFLSLSKEPHFAMPSSVRRILIAIARYRRIPIWFNGRRAYEVDCE